MLQKRNFFNWGCGALSCREDGKKGIHNLKENVFPLVAVGLPKAMPTSRLLFKLILTLCLNLFLCHSYRGTII